MTAPRATRLNEALHGRYRIERQLGEGGMATVYLAEDLKHHRKVAIKVLRPELAAVVGGERFLAEIETTANLQHPHILPLFDSGEADGFLYYVMPYVEGESLRERLDREKQLPVDEAVDICTKVAGALQGAHDNGVVHRDIKPANILLAGGEPLVADFGIALAVSAAGGNRLTETGLSLGTPHYMSPEQATGELNVGSATDVYSLGCVLYEALVGEPPYTGITPQAVLVKVLTGDAPRAKASRASIPANVDAAITRALERLPADRFISAADFAAALTSPTYRYPRGDGDRVTPSTRRVRWAWPLAAAGGVALGLTVGLWLAPAGSRAPTFPADAIRFAVPAPGGLMMPYSQETPVVVSPYGARLAYLTAEGIAVREIDSFEARVLPNTRDVMTLMFSPDGTRIAFMQPPYLRWVPVEGGPAVTVAEIGSPGGLGSTWTEEGGFLLTAAGSNGIVWVSEDGGERVQLTEVMEEEGENIHAWPQDLPGTEAIIYTALGPGGGWADGKTVMFNPVTGERRILIENGTNALYSSTGHLLYVDAAGTVFAVPFDVASGETTGSPAPVVSGVRPSVWGGGAGFHASRSGVLAWIEGSELERLELVSVDRSGAVQEEFGVWPVGFIRLSPDAERLLIGVATGDNIDQWILDPGTGQRERFTFDINEEESAVWSPDGERIMWASAQPGGGRIAYVQDADRSTERARVFDHPHHLHVTDWSSDGRYVTFYDFHPTRGADLYVVDLEDSARIIPVARTPFNEQEGAFSPDGRWLAYMSDENGRFELFALSVPDAAQKRQLTTGGGAAPTWNRNPRELFYLDRGWASSEPPTLIARRIGPGGLRELGAEERLFTLPAFAYYQPAPDGRSFYVPMQRPEARAYSIKVLLNWTAELEQ